MGAGLVLAVVRELVAVGDVVCHTEQFFFEKLVISCTYYSSILLLQGNTKLTNTGRKTVPKLICDRGDPLTQPYEYR